MSGQTPCRLTPRLPDPSLHVRLGQGVPRGHAGTVNLMECGRNDARDAAGDTDGYALAATPVTAAQV